MSAEPAVGVLGCTGAVGQTVLRALSGAIRVKAGGRDLGRVKQVIREKAIGKVVACAVDLDNTSSLSAFCEGCNVVINCTGPSYRILNRVAVVANELGVDYVDPGGDDLLHRLLTQSQPAQDENGRTASILSAGMLPGLSGLLCRDVARHFDTVDHLSGYSGGVEAFSYAGADEFIASLGNGYGRSGACIRNGRLQSDTEGFDGRQTMVPLIGVVAEAFPFISTEFQRACQALSVLNGSWFNLFVGRHVIDFLFRVRGESREHNATVIDPALISGLVSASALDAAGRAQWQMIAVEAQGKRNGVSKTRTVLLHAQSGAALTGIVCAGAALELVQGRVAKGVHFAADVLSQTRQFDYIKYWLPTARFFSFDGTMSVEEEGAL